jgi:uncharacterized protein|nr:radical SAM protein [uncultured Acetatifactor sp.]
MIAFYWLLRTTDKVEGYARMHYIGDYIYDSDRLIFYERDMPEHVIKKVKECIEVSDYYEKLRSGYECLDKNNMSAKGKHIDLIGVCLTYNCQLRCNYCSYSSTSGNYNDLDTKDVLAFVVEAIKIRMIYQMAHHVVYDKPLRFFFTGGGEPTFDWNLFEKTVCAIKKKCEEYSIPCYLELTTNGMLNDNQRSFVIDHFNKVMVSYDGIAEIQNKNRKCANTTESSKTVEESIRAFMESKLFLVVRTTVWHEDFVALKEIYNNLAKNYAAIDEWSIMPILPSGRALVNAKPGQYDINQKNFFDYYIELIEYVQNQETGLYISSAVFNNSIVEYCCGATFDECFWLMPDKTIVNCIEAERFKTEVGRIENDKVLFYDCYVDLYLDIVRDTFDNCRNCLAYRFCKGGCPLKTIRDEEYGTNYRKYECQMIVQYWEYVFHKILRGGYCFGWGASQIEKDEFEGYKVFQLRDMERRKQDAD